MRNQIAKDLLKIGAVFLRPQQPFIWASGIKSPIYCDNRLILSFPSVRDRVEQAIAQTVQSHYPDCQILLGTSTAGIAHAAIAAHLLKLPAGYVRSSAKDHGRKGKIEGKMEKGAKVVVIEDLISTAGSVLDVVETIRKEGGEVLGIVSIFTYGMQKGKERLQAAHTEAISLTDFDAILEEAVASGTIQPADIGRLKAFRDNPTDESWIQGGLA